MTSISTAQTHGLIVVHKQLLFAAPFNTPSMIDLVEIEDPPTSGVLLTAAHTLSGPPIDPLARLLTYNGDEWEKFIREWVSHLKTRYAKVLRFGGAGDKGIDVAGCVDARTLLRGIWDNFQCKFSGRAIGPSVAWPEIGKMLWYSFNGDYTPPRAYYFVAPKETTPALTHLLGNSVRLKKRLFEVWDGSIRDSITDAGPISLTGKFRAYVDAFDFSIFRPQPILEIIEQHRLSPYFPGRFGGGLPTRPVPPLPPDEIAAKESRYIEQLLEAYAQHKSQATATISDLKNWKALEDHFRRSRESFYHAEALRVFVRDKVEPGTFESLQETIYDSVIDTCDAVHADGYARVVAVTNFALTVALDAHPLAPSAFPADRRGICHQLANEDRLKWTR